MAAEIARQGGSLNLGIYAVDKDVGDLHGRIQLFYDKVMTNPFILDFFDVRRGRSAAPTGVGEALRAAHEPDPRPARGTRASSPAT